MFGRFEKRVIKAVRIVPETRLRHGWPGLGQELHFVRPECHPLHWIAISWEFYQKNIVCH